MATTSGRPVSPAELSALEHAFASEPNSEAYRPLTEAYLAAGRFMEAMVVCKKGVKAHPDDPSARVLLARVHAGQGKDRRALEEVDAVLAAFPAFVAANVLAATLHLRLGERDAGEAALRRAAEAAPDDPEVKDLLAKHGIAFAPARPAPAAPARPGPPGVPVQGGPPVAPRVAPPGAAPPAPAASAPTPAPEPSIDVPLPTPVPSRRQADLAYAEELARKYGTQGFHLPEKKAPVRKGRAALFSTLGLVAVLGVALFGWMAWSAAERSRAASVKQLLDQVLPEVERDDYPGYLAARKHAQEMLAIDPASQGADAYLAYVDALLWAEHGEGEDVRKEAEAHLDAGLKAGKPHSHLYAADAYLRARGGDPAGARTELERVLSAQQVPFLTAVLGAVLLQEGDLDAARDALLRAHNANQGDVRTAWLMAEQYRRRGEGYELQATGYYDRALRSYRDHAKGQAGDHVPSVLGKALVVLGRGQVDEAGRAADRVLAAPASASKPELAIARAIRGTVLAARGKGAEAAAEEAEAVKLDPRNPDLPWLVGMRKLRAGDAAGAVEAFQRAVALDNRRVALYADLTRAQLAREGGAREAVETLKRAVARLGDTPRLVLLLGDAYRAAGDADLATGQYEKAMRLQRPFPDARVALARLYRAQGKTPAALVELTQAIEEYGAGGTGGAAAAYVEMADAERSRNAKPAVLKELYDKALERDPANCDALWGAGKLDAEAGLSEAGRRRLEGYVKTCPGAPHAAEAARLVGQ